MKEAQKKQSRREGETKAKRLLFLLFGVLITLSVVHISLQYININLLSEEQGSFYELTNRFDFDDEASIPTWVAQLLFLLISGVAFLLFYLEKEKAKKAIWPIVAVVALLGSLDEVATLHENLLQSIHLLFYDESTPTALANAWILIVPFVLVVTLVFARKAKATLPKKTLKLLITALALYVTGAIFIDIFTSSYVTNIGFMGQGIMVAVEEVLELAGLSIALYAIVDYTEVKFSNNLMRAKKELLK